MTGQADGVCAHVRNTTQTLEEEVVSSAAAGMDCEMIQTKWSTGETNATGCPDRGSLKHGTEDLPTRQEAACKQEETRLVVSEEQVWEGCRGGGWG